MSINFEIWQMHFQVNYMFLHLLLSRQHLDSERCHFGIGNRVVSGKNCNFDIIFLVYLKSTCYKIKVLSHLTIVFGFLGRKNVREFGRQEILPVNFRKSFFFHFNFQLFATIRFLLSG